MAMSSEQPSANIKITSPSPQFGSQPLSFTLPLSMTVQELKGKITDSLDGRPSSLQQRLIYRGKILNDDSTISTVLGASANGEIINSEASGFYTFHLALRPTATVSSQGGLSTNVAANPFSNLPTASPPPYTLATYGSELSNASQQAHAQPVATAAQPGIRVSSSLGDPLPDLTSMMTTRILRENFRPPAIQHSNTPLENLYYRAQRSAAARTVALAQQPLYLLQGPDGYRGLLIPPPQQEPTISTADGYLTTSLMAEVEAFGRNAAEMGQTPQLPQLNISNFGVQAFYAQPAAVQVPNVVAPPAIPAQQNPPAQRLHITPAEWLQRMRERASHLWLAVRLVVFVVLFSGGGGLRRTIALGGLALFIFIWQTGILSEQWTNAQNLYQELFPPRHRPDPLNRARLTALQQQAPGAPHDPAMLAQLLVQRDNERRTNRWRETIESIERGITVFLASLVPGLHERHIEAHEERQRQREHMAGAMAAQQQQGGQASQLPPGRNEAQQEAAPERNERPGMEVNNMMIAGL